MKFTNKQTQFQSKKPPYPTYINSFVRDGKIEINENSTSLLIQYLHCHTVDNKEVVISRSDLLFTDAHTPTTILNSSDEEQEVYEAILTGETYYKSKIINWGKPSLDKVMQMFKLDSLDNAETGLVLKDLTEVSVDGNIIPINENQSAQIKQLMLDWLKENVIVENEKLGINFQII